MHVYKRITHIYMYTRIKMCSIISMPQTYSTPVSKTAPVSSEDSLGEGVSDAVVDAFVSAADEELVLFGQG